MIVFTCIILLILAIIIFFIFGKKVKFLSYKITFIILLIFLIIIGYFFTKIIYKTTTKTSTSYQQLNETKYNPNIEEKDLNLYKSKSTIIVGSSANLPPWYYKKNNVVIGYNIDLIKEAVKLMGKKISFVVYNNEEELYSALEQNKIDVIADFGFIDKDNNNFTYSIKFVSPPFVFIGNKQHLNKLLNNKENAKIPYEKFLNKSIVTENLSIFTTTLYDLLGKSTKFTVLYNIEDVLTSIEKNKFEVGFVDYFSFLYYKNTYSKLITISPLISIPNRNGFGFIVNSSNLVLLQQLNISLNILKRRGEMSNLSIKYFKEDVTL